jgi:hypothetical protein
LAEQIFSTTAYMRRHALLGDDRVELHAFFLPRDHPPTPLFFEREFFDTAELAAAQKLSQLDAAARDRLKADPRQVALFNIAVMLGLAEGPATAVPSLDALPRLAHEIVDTIDIPVTESPLSGKTITALIAGTGAAAAAHVSVGQVLELGAAFALVTSFGILIIGIARPLGETVGDQLATVLRRRLERFLPSRRPKSPHSSSSPGGRTRTA